MKAEVAVAVAISPDAFVYPLAGNGVPGAESGLDLFQVALGTKQ